MALACHTHFGDAEMNIPDWSHAIFNPLETHLVGHCGESGDTEEKVTVAMLCAAPQDTARLSTAPRSSPVRSITECKV